ncbi:MAG: vitamin K epoxide reductase family protein [Candidatus Wildermuthbacteria bacterium]|nr:vitamin K epoxide reductase family protein [Candidatus Wildermuthbacteria bacterium]
MMNLNHSLNKPFSKFHKWLLGGFLGLSFLGFLDASYLAAEHYLGIPLTCVVFSGCEKVLDSEYSAIFGVPIALFGAGYYAAIFVLAAAFLETRRRMFLNAAAFLPLAGSVVSLFLVYLQIFVLKALCQYCLISAFITFALLGIACAFLFSGRQLKQDAPESV